MSHIELRKGWHHEHTLLNDQTKECLLDHFLNVSGSLNAIAFDPTMIEHTVLNLGSPCYRVLGVHLI